MIYNLDGRYVLIVVMIQSSPFLLSTIYAPNRYFVDEYNFDSRSQLIIVADLNVHSKKFLDNLDSKMEEKRLR